MSDATNAVRWGVGSDRPFSMAHIVTLFGEYLDNADENIEMFFEDHTVDGVLDMSASDSLDLQYKMSQRGIVAQTATSVLKDAKESVMVCARNL